MADHAKTLIPHLADGYSSKVMGQGSHDTALNNLVAELKKDPDFRKHVEREIGKLQFVRRRCFVSGVSADFLKEALERANVE
jgi:hypothetical protein